MSGANAGSAESRCRAPGAAPPVGFSAASPYPVPAILPPRAITGRQTEPFFFLTLQLLRGVPRRKLRMRAPKVAGAGSRAAPCSPFSATGAAFRVQAPRQPGPRGPTSRLLTRGAAVSRLTDGTVGLFCTRTVCSDVGSLSCKTCVLFSRLPRAVAVPRLPSPPADYVFPSPLKSLCANQAVTVPAQGQAVPPRGDQASGRRQARTGEAAGPPRPPPPRPLRLLNPWVERAPPMRWRGAGRSGAERGGDWSARREGGGAEGRRPEASGAAAAAG